MVDRTRASGATILIASGAVSAVALISTVCLAAGWNPRIGGVPLDEFAGPALIVGAASMVIPFLVRADRRLRVFVAFLATLCLLVIIVGRWLAAGSDF